MTQEEQGMATAKKKAIKSKATTKKLNVTPAKKKVIGKPPASVHTTSTSVVSANLVAIGGYEEQRRAEMGPLIKKAAKIAGEFADLTKKIAAFETKILYKYLGETYELYKEIKKDKHSETYFHHLRYYLKEKGIRTTKDTSEISLLIRLIFVVKPKTAHLYSRAIEAAETAKIKPTAFVEYVEAEGGLEQLRISQVEKEKAQQYRSALKQANDLAMRYLRAREGQPLAITEIPLDDTHITENGFVVMIGIGFAQPGNPNRNAEIRILSCMPNVKDTEDFVISSIAKNFANNITQAEKFVEKIEGKVSKLN